MFRKTLFLCVALGLMAAMTVGCEEKKPAAPAPEVKKTMDQAADQATDSMDQAKEAGEATMQDAAAAAKDAADKTGEAAEAVKDAMPESKPAE